MSYHRYGGFLALAISSGLSAAGPPSTLLGASIKPISVAADGHYAGSGWTSLVADADQAQFLMVGEQHGSADIARFETALQLEMAGRGYSHSALEIGPISTRFAERLIREGAGKLQQYIGAPGHGITLPFLYYAEEAAMAENMVRTSPDKKHALIGLDQEFVGSAPILVSELRSLARSRAEQQALDKLETAAEKDSLLVGKIDEPQLETLKRAFAANPRARSIIQAIEISARIYKPFISGAGPGYPANLEREQYMKMNFVPQFEAAARRNGKAPKVFFKFGGSHAMRGMSSTDVPALANFIAEWGLPRGYRMVNVLVDCVGGEVLNPQTKAVEPCQSYFGSDTAIGAAVATGEGVQLIDFRPLRPLLGRDLKSLDVTSRKMILAYDYYVVVHDGRAATPTN